MSGGEGPTHLYPSSSGWAKWAKTAIDPLVRLHAPAHLIRSSRRRRSRGSHLRTNRGHDRCHMSREDHDPLIRDLLSLVKAPRDDHRIPLIKQHPACHLVTEQQRSRRSDHGKARERRRVGHRPPTVTRVARHLGRAPEGIIASSRDASS
jgi:hypothetical protein